MDSGCFTLHDISPIMNERMGRMKVPPLAAALPQCARQRRRRNASKAAQWMWHNLKVQTKLFHFTGGNVLGPFTPLFSSFVSPSLRPSLSLPSLPPLPPVAPCRIQFCSFIPTSSPARFLLFISPPPPISSPHLSLLFQRSLALPCPPARPSPPRPLLRVSTPQSSPSNPVNSSQ